MHNRKKLSSSPFFIGDLHTFGVMSTQKRFPKDRHIVLDIYDNEDPDNSELTEDASKSLGQTLQNPLSPSRLTIVCNYIRTQDMKHIAEGLKSRKHFEDLTFDFEDSFIDSDGARILASALQYAPRRLTVNLSNNDFHTKRKKSKPTASGGTIAFATEIGNGNVLEGTSLILRNMKFNPADAVVFTVELRKGRSPNYLSLDLGNDGGYETKTDNTIQDKGAKSFATVFKTGKAAKGFRLNLTGNQIDTKGAVALAEAIGAGKTALECHLDLTSNMIGDNGAQAFARMIANGGWPNHFTLILKSCLITDPGMIALISALKKNPAVRTPTGLYLAIGDKDNHTTIGNNISENGIKALANLLQSGEALENLILDLSGLIIANKDVKTIAKALSEGPTLDSFTLVLSAKYIENEGIRYIIEAMKSPKAVSWQVVFDVTPTEMLGLNASTKTLLRQVDELNIKNTMMPTACVQFQRGIRQQRSPLLKLQQAIVNNVFSFFFPFKTGERPKLTPQKYAGRIIALEIRLFNKKPATVNGTNANPPKRHQPGSS